MTDINRWLDFALQQVAAESYLDYPDIFEPSVLRSRLIDGNNDQRVILETLFKGVTRLTSQQADNFVSRYRIVDHYANDASGFSATLLFDTEAEQYTLSFRSTEYRNQEEGGDWERDGAPNMFSLAPAGADGEMVALGFALGQLSAMETYYTYLRDSGLLPVGVALNVTGYSLGGHLATVFTELHVNDVAHAYTFNSPGRGGFEDVQASEGIEAIRISQMLGRFKEVVFDPDAGRTIFADPENAGFAALYQAAYQAQIADPDWTPFEENSDQNIYLDSRYQWAKLVVTREFRPDSRADEGIFLDQIRTDGAFSKITQIVGHATHGDIEYVASSQYHPPETRVFIEDQPDLDGFAGVFGASGDFGSTHSITLIVDSLALQGLFQSLSPQLTQSQIEALIAASSAQKASGFLGTKGTAEGDSLERALDALYELFTGDSSATPYSRQTRGFGDLENRTQYYERIERVRDLAAAMQGNIGIESLGEKSSHDLVQTAGNPDPGNTTSIAYRYALKTLNPFAVVGTTIEASSAIYAIHNTNSELALYDPVTRSGTLSLQWIQDRAAMLAALNEARTNDAVNGSDQLSAKTGGVVFKGYDGAGTAITILPAGISFGIRNLIAFDNDQAHDITGQMKDDHLYGGGGDDVISGADGVDWLEGGDDNDSLYGESGGDWLFGGKGDDLLDGGRGTNVLDGGNGFDAYVHDSSNGGFDYIQDNDGRILVDGVAVTGGKKLDRNVYLSPDRRTGYLLDGTTLIIDGTITVLDFQNGDLGITLGTDLVFDDVLGDATTGGVLASLDGRYVLGSPDFDVIAVAGIPNVFQYVLAGSGNDVLFAPSNPRATIEGGSGADYVVGSDNNDALGGEYLAEGIINNPGNVHVINNHSWILDEDEHPGLVEVTFWDGFESDTPEPRFYSLGYFTYSDAAKQVLGVNGTTDLSTFWNDVLEGRGGNDYMTGELGSDRLFGQDGDDWIEDGGTWISGASGFFLELTKLEAQASDADYLDGGDGNDILRSSSGQDWMVGGEGDDFISGGVIVDGGAGADFISNDLQGNVGASLSGGDGDDIIKAGNGATIDGGAGEDTIIVAVSSISDAGSVSIKDSDGASRFILDTADSINPHIPLTFVKKAADLVVYLHSATQEVSVITWTDWFSTPDSGADFTYVGGFYGLGGGHGQNFFDTGALANAPFDPYYLTTRIAPEVILSKQQIEAATKVFVEGSEMNDQIAGDEQSEVIFGYDGDDTIDGAAGDDAMEGGVGADHLSGGAGSDTIYGGDGNDYLDGNSGADQLNGGADDDIYIVDSSGDFVTEFFYAGTDRVLSSVTYVLPSNVENLALTGNAPINGTGNFLSNVIVGNSADNELDGLGGDDSVTGGLGQDTYIYGLNYGNDTILEGGAAGEIDSVQFAGGLNSSDVALTVETGNLVVSLLATDERLVITNWMNPASRVERLVFADLTLDETQLLLLFPQNSPPTTANPIGDQNATEDSVFSFQVPANSFADVDASDTLSYVATLVNGLALPSWLTFNAFSHTFSGTPLNADVGTIGVKVIATDGWSASAFDTFDIVVANTNDAPTVANAIANQAATEDTSFLFQVPANSLADVDVGDLLGYSAMLSSGTALPSWLSFNAATGTFSGMPANGDVGTISVKVVATDTCSAMASDVFDIVVANTNDAPTVANAIPDRNATEDSAFSYQVPVNSFADVDAGDALSYVATLANGSALPSWLSFNSGTCTFSGTPINADVGAISVRVTATDGASAAASDVFDIEVANINDVPILANVIADQIATEDAAFNFQVPINSFIDVDADDTLAYSAILADGSALPTWLTFNAGTRAFSGMPVNDNVGSVRVRVVATDSENAVESGEFTLTVVNTNDAPVVSSPLADQTVSAGGIFNWTVLTNAFSDTDSGDILSYSATLASGSVLPLWLAFDPVTRTFLGKPGALDVGTWQVRVNATDLDGASTFDVFALTVVAPVGRTIVGTNASDRLYGTDFDDVIDGRSGADTMIGNRGDDTYYVDNIRDRVTELAGQGDDIIFSSVTYTLPDNVESITLTGTGSTRASGNSADNRLVGNGGKNILIGNAGNDTLDGKSGGDSMIGGTGDDTYYVDSALDTVTELVGQGIDSVQSTVNYALAAHVENLMLIGSAQIDGRGNAASNFLVGNAATNSLSGTSGNDILQGLGGNDVLGAAGGHTLFDGGAGADAITGSAGNEMFIGGIGNDTISTGTGADIIAFNAGDGRDVITSSAGARSVLSIGNGIDYASLTFTKSGNNLIMKTGGRDQITFKDWYSRANSRSITRLQVFTEAMPDYDRNSTYRLLDDKVEQFNFIALVNAFDAAGQVSGWALTHALLSAHLSGSDTEAIGGDLAYQYGKNGTLSGIGLTSAQDVLNASQFGSGMQTLRPIEDVQQGRIRLS